MIEVKNISKSFNEHKVLDGINAEFQPGQVSMIIGQSGSGKTVLLKSIIGLYIPEDGEILFDGREFVGASIKFQREIRKEIGMLFQGGALFTSLTVEENVMFPLNLFTDYSKSEKLDRVNFCLERVNIKDSNYLYPAEISGGMQKRVAIARAISLNPKYLFCDEPNSGLDPQNSILIDRLIKELTQEYNMTTIVNTHDMNSVMEIADKVYFINKAKVWWSGNNEEIFHSDNKELNDFVFASELFKKIKENL
ncbi:MAG: ATP-binding cassette domain-containing protein [Bacteroidales bacterium]|jgi:phospholipid/cholesterol/gamma-HCH transport system ATP-binding protein|nr:ATP-binding cassette domain-containing protein [Bacteroidales bacterium]